ncbi:uncharacterized protein LOC115557835 isoform X2 [Gadus morhua]|uniref:uncharacterized protein LOC115557835 isoform X2 n=1 Tax=Gadus morhua TaxID=8049 RepID=UPI0011B62CFC|nr:uncharacterized protein LOC115557835 isoform X2 [Gadus morhua]
MGCRFSGPWIEGEPGVSGRHVSQLSKQDALRILAAYEQPITMQIKPRRHFRQNGNTHGDGRSWETLPLSLQNLSLPLQAPRPPASDPRGSPASQDRRHWRHLVVQQDRCDEGMYEYLPTAPQDTIDMGPVGYQDKDLTSRDPNNSSCLLGCCNNPAEPSSFYTQQMEDSSIMAENPHGYLPLHHELDSGLGWTDGSLHQGDLSGLETEEGGLDECHQYSRGYVQGGCAGHGFGRGSPSSESYMSSELSDSGFCSVSTGEFRRFQRLLEKRMRLYNARLHHPAEPSEKRERRDSCPKSHRELLEAIPEALAMQPLLPNPRAGVGHSSDPAMGFSPCGLSRVSSVQFRKEDQPCLNRHSSSSGALFNPSHGHTSMGMPILSTCSTPSSHHRPMVLGKQHQASNSVGILRRSRTLHYRPAPHEYRRRASHPASPSYTAATLDSGETVGPQAPEQRETSPSVLTLNHASHALSPHPHPHPTAVSHPQGTHGPFYSTHLPPHDWPQPRERSIKTELVVPKEERIRRARPREASLQNDPEKDKDLQADRVQDEERKREFVGDSKSDPHCFHTLSLPPQPGDINETWPKPASRLSQGGGCGGGLYSTLELHSNPGPGSMPQWADNEKPNTISTSNPHAHSTHITNTNQNTRLSRNQLLRNRASRLADERGGMSTDEETNTEMLQGRYWSRTERREHLLIAREQRQQQQRARGAPMREGQYNRGVTVGEDRSTENQVCDEDQFFVEGRCNTVLELSQRKLNHLRNRKLYDDWTTVEELLSHGIRMDSRESKVCPSNLLTVTTV